MQIHLQELLETFLYMGANQSLCADISNDTKKAVKKILSCHTCHDLSYVMCSLSHVSPFTKGNRHSHRPFPTMQSRLQEVEKWILHMILNLPMKKWTDDLE